MSQDAVIALHGRRMSLAIEITPRGAALWRHWGARAATDPPPPGLAQTRTRSSFALDEEVTLETAPGFGTGWFGAPFLAVHRGGSDFTTRFTVEDVDATAASVTLRLVDRATALGLEQRFALDPASDVLTISAVLTNHGDAPLNVDALAAALLPLPAEAACIRSFTGRHNAEFVEQREPMPAHGWARETRRGLTGHGGPPGLFVLGDGAGWHAGEVWAAQLAWSGNHRLAIERRDDGAFTLWAGEALAPGEIVLAPGATLATPELLATYSPDGLNGASQNFHAAIRARMQWPGGERAPRPIHYNSWEAVYFDHDEARLTALADRAAALGCERFVLDDGWFAGRDSDRRGLGDWRADPRRYPHGLGPLARHVTALGMGFGLWVEPEMVNPDSDLYRAHPDWVLGAGVRPPITARNQLVLDLGRAAVRDHLFDALDALLREVPIRYLKWDHNRDLAPATDTDGRARYRAQVLGAYALIDRLRAAHPLVEIEACAGGGGRIDAGIAARAHRFWTSDNLDAVSRVAIQRGFLAFMPPELMGAHIGAAPAHATGRRQSMAFRCAVAFAGHLGIELDPGTLTGDDAQVVRTWFARYRQCRDRLHHGAVWLGEGADGLMWQAHGAPEDLMLMATRVAPPLARHPQPLRLPMLAGVPRVKARLIDLAGARAAPEAEVFAAMRDGGVAFSGSWLAAHGLPMPALAAESMALFELVAV